MDKIKTTVHIDGKDYNIRMSTTAEYAQRIAAYVDGRLAEAKASSDRLSSEMAFILASFGIADELFRTKDELTYNKNQVADLQKELAKLRREYSAPQTETEPPMPEAADAALSGTEAPAADAAERPRLGGRRRRTKL